MERLFRPVWVMVMLVAGTFSEEFKRIELKPFRTLAHGVRSGPIYIVSETTFFIKDFNYDGTGRDAHFWAGKGVNGPDSKGTLVWSDKNAKALGAYHGKDIYLLLPNGLTYRDIDYLGVYCVLDAIPNFGYTLIAERPVAAKLVKPRIDKYTHVELKPFSTLAHGLRSGPIFVVNETTFFITNLHYDGKGPDAHFWAGRGKRGPDSLGILVPDEKNSRDSIGAYNGEDVYITLPDGLTVRNIDYFGVWCIEYSQNFGYTVIGQQPNASMINNPRIDVIALLLLVMVWSRA